MRRLLLLTIISLIIISLNYSCIPRDTADLGGGYYYVNHSIIYGHKENTSVIACDTFLIYMSVEDYNMNNDYILARQVLDKDNIWYYVDSIKQDSVRKKLEEALSIGTCYWIIDKKRKDVLGPMRRVEFDCARESLGISINLTK